LAAAYLEDKQYKNAISYYEQAVEQQPENVILLNDLAWLYTVENDPRALKLAEKAYDLLPDEPGIIDTYGWALLQNNQTQKALVMLETAAERMPDEAEVQYHYAVALHKSGDVSAARAILKRVIESGSDFEGRQDAMNLYDK
jgi:tetratricopeptide (TPR) repeat protein